MSKMPACSAIILPKKRKKVALPNKQSKLIQNSSKDGTFYAIYYLYECCKYRL